MGIFDEVNYKAKCPSCGAKVSGFQTKDGEPSLRVVEIDEIQEWYTSCDKCHYWINFHWVIESCVWSKDKKRQTVVRYIDEKSPYSPDYCLPAWCEKEL